MPAHGSFAWNELATSDVGKAKSFYGDLLGWTYQAMPMAGGLTYTIVGKADLMKPFTVDPERLGYRPYYPEEDVKRAQMRNEAFDLVTAAKAKASAPTFTPSTH